MATSTSMKTSLVVLLLLSAVVASHAHQVSCKNTCKKPILVNNIWIDVDGTSLVEVVEGKIDIAVYDIENVKHNAQYKCGEDVVALIFSYDGVFLKVKITALSVLGGLVHSVLGALTDLIKCTLPL